MSSAGASSATNGRKHHPLPAPLRRLGESLGRIGPIQIAAVPSRAEPDEGELDYRSIMQTLEAIGYKGFIGCEYRLRSDTDAGLAWRDRIL